MSDTETSTQPAHAAQKTVSNGSDGEPPFHPIASDLLGAGLHALPAAHDHSDGYYKEARARTQLSSRWATSLLMSFARVVGLNFGTLMENLHASDY